MSLIARNVNYSEVSNVASFRVRHLFLTLRTRPVPARRQLQLARLFDRMKFQEKTFQTLLDMQLAFVRKVHLVVAHIGEEERRGGRTASVGRVSLLAQQLKIIASVGLGVTNGGVDGDDVAPKGSDPAEPPKNRGRGRSRPRSLSRGRKKE